MTRLVSYNILAGGYDLREGRKRTDHILKILSSLQADVVGVVEAVHPQIKERPWIVEELAEELQMQLILGGDSAHKSDYRLALLTRLPVSQVTFHTRPGILAKPLLEVCVRESKSEELTIFVTHLFASFAKGRGGGHLRLREVEEIMNILTPYRAAGKPHVLMGDFNSLAPGDSFQGSNLLRYVKHLDEHEHRKNQDITDGNPHMEYIVPPRLRFLLPILRQVPRNRLLARIFDLASSFYVPRGCIRTVTQHGYIDCYRQAHPNEHGFTCPARMPAGRIDYLFASPEMALRLEDCREITQVEDLQAGRASDHLPLLATFHPPTTNTLKEPEIAQIER